MSNILYPDIYVDSILDIPLDKLQQLNIKAFILDLDNTLTEWNSNELKDDIVAWFDEIKSRGLKACILSNNGEKRVITVAQRLGIPYLFRAQKPRRRAFRQAVALMGLNSSEVAVIGDQIFTDILGGNRAGLFTVLVVPIAKREFIGTKVSRCMEFFVLHRLRRKFKL